ncbi:MAG TPA: PEGA domain-containing protein, partial [Kofleriaceae bacterium]|nr:PEGA domain-containing protein [Kofleriaceae bacterium]
VAAAPAAPAAAPACFADVTSQPPGAEIVVDQSVVGTTPRKLALPCGAPVEIVIRKGHLLAATRTVTPTADGAPVRVALARQTFLVKVSSMPAGATITLGGKSLGVTPTTVKLNAFEPAALALSKEGYAGEIEQVTPKANGIAVHSVLKKLPARR